MRRSFWLFVPVLTSVGRRQGEDSPPHKHIWLSVGGSNLSGDKKWALCGVREGVRGQEVKGKTSPLDTTRHCRCTEGTLRHFGVESASTRPLSTSMSLESDAVSLFSTFGCFGLKRRPKLVETFQHSTTTARLRKLPTLL